MDSPTQRALWGKVAMRMNRSMHKIKKLLCKIFKHKFGDTVNCIIYSKKTCKRSGFIKTSIPLDKSDFSGGTYIQEPFIYSKEKKEQSVESPRRKFVSDELKEKIKNLDTTIRHLSKIKKEYHKKWVQENPERVAGYKRQQKIL